MATKKAAKKTSKRTVLEPHKGDRRYVRRNKEGEFKKEVNIGRSLAADRRSKAKTTVKKGQGDRGDVKRQLAMIPVSLEELPADLRQSATTYLAQHPSGFAARAKPRLGRDGDRWYVLHGPDTQSGIAGFGFTIEAAYESWEANYKEAVSAEQ